MLKFFFILALFLSHCIIFHGNAFSPPYSTIDEQPLCIPDHFFVKQRWLSWTSSFDIESESCKLGTVHRHFLSSTLHYDFYDKNERLQSNARMRFFSFGAIFDIHDAMQNEIGHVREKIFTFFPVFEIFSAKNDLIILAKMNFWGTRYTLIDPSSKEKFATLSRPLFRLKDDWKVTITNQEIVKKKKIDPALLIIVMTFQTDLDFWSAYAQHQTMSPDYHPAEIKKQSENQHLEFVHIRKYLEFQRPILESHMPQKEDFLIVDQKVEEWLNRKIFLSTRSQIQHREEIFTTYIQVRKEKLLEGLLALTPLFDSEAFTLPQKNALLLMMDSQLKQLGY